jgi:3-dehydroquinate synthase
MKKIKVNLGKKSYHICIENGILSSAGRIIKSLHIAKTCYIITNKKIKSLYGDRLSRSILAAGMDVGFCVVPDSERAKSHLSWFKVLENLARFDKGKGVCVVALGGGVVGDLAGFVASTYRRGVAFVQIPTTLLAQVDSAIGGKVAIDMDFAKNLVGAFYQPKVVITDISTIKSLPKRQIRNGLAEIIKYAVILDKKFFSYLERNALKIMNFNRVCTEDIVACCSKLKAEVVAADEHEKLGYRSILNFGHTIGHAIETASSYKSSINHGEAVAVGMVAAFDISLMLKMTKKPIAQRVEGLIKQVGLPVSVNGIDPEDVINATAFDKKIVKGKRRWVLPIDIGHVIVCDKVPQDVIKAALLKRLN